MTLLIELYGGTVLWLEQRAQKSSVGGGRGLELTRISTYKFESSALKLYFTFLKSL